MKKPAIKLDFTRINDNYSCVILTKLIKHVKIESKFGENHLISDNSKVYYKLNKKVDFDIPIVIKNEEIEEFKKVFNEINQEFGIQERWRANKNEKYFLVSALGTICDSIELNSDTDNKRYEAGNYFKTEKEAKLLSDLYKQSLEIIRKQNK
jgi:putative uncharacterized protein FNV0866